MADRRALLALGAVALFGAGFGLGWLVRGERGAAADVDPASATHAAPAGPGEGSAESAAEAAGGGTDPSDPEGRSEGADGEAAETPGGEGSVAVVGGGAGAGGASGAPAPEGDETAGAGDESAPAPGDGGVVGRLGAESIRDEVREHRDELGFCFAWQLHQNPELGGRITMEFEIGPEGQVTEARVADDQLGDETVLRCFVGVTRRMEFPPPEGGGTVTVRYPFILRPDGDPDASE